MNKRKLHSVFLTIAILFFSCGQSDKEGNAFLQKKKDELQKLLKEKEKMDGRIQALQAEIYKLDTGLNADRSAKLVSLSTVTIQRFEHYIDLRGRIDAENISFITPRGMGGQVKQIFVKEGDNVRKGQLLLKLDDAIMKQSYQAARQQIESIKTQLQFARTVYDRQNNLWQKGIGTEIQVLNAKTNVETLENQLKSAQEQLFVLQEQIKTAEVYSDVDGVAETVMVKVGELFGGMGQIKIVNTAHLKAVGIVPENYVSRVKVGTPVSVEVKEASQVMQSNVSLVGQTIENTQRGFVIEAKIPTNKLLKPNQTALLRIKDYSVERAIVVPVNTIQSDELNKYVYVSEKNATGKTVAVKKIIKMGEVYGENAEVISGLSGGEQLITAGYQNLYEGQVIRFLQ